MKKLLLKREIVPAFLVVIALFAGSMESKFFLDFKYLLSASNLYVETGLLVLGMTLVIICGQIDLSVGSTLALTACCAAKLLDMKVPVVAAFLLTILLGGFLGWINGTLITKLKLPSFVVTLGTMAAYRGLAQILLGPTSLRFPSNLTGINYLKFMGSPVPVTLVLFLVLARVIGLVLNRTLLGRWFFTVGTNIRASHFSGVKVDRVLTSAFVISGCLAGVAGLIMDSRLTVARFDHAKGIEVDVITAVVLGGTPIAGGSGSILGSGLALLLIALIRIGMGLANISAEYQLAVIGLLLILTVATGNLVVHATDLSRFVKSRLGFKTSQSR